VPTIILLGLAVAPPFPCCARERELSVRLHLWVDYLEAPLGLADYLRARLALE
jgi:hypothetical protein